MTAESESTFEDLKRAAIKFGKVQDLKLFFKDEIGSTRNMERIQSMVDLIDCLERRDILSQHNITPLLLIAQLSQGQLKTLITNNHVQTKEKIDPSNEYRNKRRQQQQQQNEQLNCNQGNNLELNKSQQNENSASSGLCGKKRSAIYKLIATEIGSKTRHFGSILGLRQGELDWIENNVCASERVYKILEMFEESELHDHKHDVLILCRAMDECSRKDLRQKIENLMCR